MDLDAIRLDFVPTARLRRLAMVAGLAVALAVVTSHGELLVVAVVPLVLLVGAPRSGVPTGLEVSVALSTARTSPEGVPASRRSNAASSPERPTLSPTTYGAPSSSRRFAARVISRAAPGVRP